MRRAALSIERMAAEQDQRISETFERESSRLRSFIGRRVPDENDAEDILQDVFYELVLAYRLMKPIEQVSAWLFRVARNRTIDLFRKRRPEAETRHTATQGDEAGALVLEELLPSAEAGPEARYARSVLWEELEEALEELPEEQQQVFIAHEIEGRSFKELAEESGLSVNTLLSRKHYAVMHLRQRLQAIYQEITER